jgi:hypothetical protein
MAQKQHLRVGEAWIHAKRFEQLPGATAVTRPASVADVYAPGDPLWREVPQGEGQSSPGPASGLLAVYGQATPGASPWRACCLTHRSWGSRRDYKHYWEGPCQGLRQTSSPRKGRAAYRDDVHNPRHWEHSRGSHLRIVLGLWSDRVQALWDLAGSSALMERPPVSASPTLPWRIKHMCGHLENVVGLYTSSISLASGHEMLSLLN